MSNILFRIDGGKALDLVKNHLAERERVNSANLAICKELGVTNAYLDSLTGVVIGVVFSSGVVPDGWKSPDTRGVSFPKRNSEWDKRLKTQKGYKEQSVEIAEAFNIPTSLGYSTPGGEGSGWRCFGVPLQECGYLWISHDGPYAMWIPDVAAEVKKSENQGFVVQEPAKSFKPEIDGCRIILEEEWELLAAQHNLNQKRPPLAATD